jgi:uncharacterized Tic20 family protein
MLDLWITQRLGCVRCEFFHPPLFAARVAMLRYNRGHHWHAVGNGLEFLPRAGEVKMADQKQCSNCGEKIGAMESTYLWQDREVCGPCYNRLRSATGADAPGHMPSAPVKSNNNNLLAALPHIGVLLGLGLIILPVILLFASSDDFVRANAREALNFHISLIIYLIVSFALCLVFIGFVLLIALAIFAFVASIIATVKACEGQLYRYPMTVRIIR